MREILDSPAWFEALSLSERAALLTDNADFPHAERLERAERKAHRWRTEADLLDDQGFAERLALDGLTPDLFLRILATPTAVLREHLDGLPDWLTTLGRLFSQPAPPLPAHLQDNLGILEVLRPLIADAYTQIRTGLHRIATTTSPAPFDPEAIGPQLLDALLRRLRWASERALVLELHASRLEGKLQGETPEERFQSFLSSLRQPGTALEILERYPVLARDACRHAGQWVETSLEMMERFSVDRGELIDRLVAGSDPGLVTEVRSGLSDRHAGGRSVAILTFASGWRAVYKPKPLAVDACFQRLIAWLDERGATPSLRHVAILDKGSYGWMEHVPSGPCATPEEVERFFQRQGAWAALFHVLEASDFHHENLIADGEHPVPIDLETLFQPSPGLTGSHAPLAHTVLRSGLLPRSWGHDIYGGLDLSGMAGEGGLDLHVNRITGEGTDRMRWGSERIRMEAGLNTPTLCGEAVPLWEQSDAVLRGFQSMYRLLSSLREELLLPEGPLALFAELPVRTLLRGTIVYSHLLRVGNHPDYLRSGLDRDRLFDRLWLETDRQPVLRRALQAEWADLANGDIPRFETRPASIDLLHSHGRVESFFANPGLEQVQDRLRSMDEDDLERQCWLIRSSLSATRPPSERRTLVATPLPDVPGTGLAEPDRFLEAARRIGDRLARLAREGGGLVAWFHLDPKPAGWHLEPVPPGLYAGLSGITLFLAHLGRLAGSERFEHLARTTLRTVRQRISGPAGLPPQIGAFDGSGGILYTFTHLGLLWDEPALLDTAEEMAVRIAPAIENDKFFDLIAGAAGGAASLLALHRHRPSPFLLETAVRCGDHLLAKAIRSDRGTAWPPFRDADPLPLTGFGHGTAGIAWALARLAQVSGESRFEEAARGAMAYERSWFSPEQGGWPDLRDDRRSTDGEREFMFAWCHGAPGIGLGRAGSLSCLDDPKMLSEIRIAARSTLSQGFGFNHSLCHGDLGNLELVREAGRVLGDPELTAEADRLATRILVQIEQEGPRWGASTETEVPGLMTGLAGTGYGLLRAAYPDRVPSVLLLETPEAR